MVPITLAHNDMFYRNILWEKSSGIYHLIDFEYSAPNYLGIDIINFCNEIMIDYSHPKAPYFIFKQENFPMMNKIRELFQFYLFMYKNPELVRSIPQDQKLLDFVRGHEDYKNIDPAEIDLYMSLVPIYGQLINIFWFWWALYTFKVEGINFDFMEFAFLKSLFASILYSNVVAGR